MNKSREALIFANEKGYEVIDGKVFYKGKEVRSNENSTGYLKFSIRMGKEKQNVFVHRLVAYQKYGDAMFESDIQVRHLDNICTNNLDDNISIGTPLQNAGDKDKETTLAAALIAADSARKHDHASIVEMYNSGMSYKAIMNKTGIKSKGTISFIIKKSIASRTRSSDGRAPD